MMGDRTPRLGVTIHVPDGSLAEPDEQFTIGLIRELATLPSIEAADTRDGSPTHLR
jgi:hypothetical protein